jgi:hypothetical protein
MSERTLVRFVAASSGNQHIAINPDFVRRLIASSPNIVAIDIGDGEPVKVEGDLVSVAKRLGFRLESDEHAHRP